MIELAGVFLKTVMLKMGLDSKMVAFIMTCVKTLTFSVLINMEPHDITPHLVEKLDTYPLSPYLFQFCTEGLIALLQRVARNKEICGLKICRRAPKINDILFTDYSLLFCEATVKENKRVQQLLNKYEAVSGQLINVDKITMFFTRNVPHETQQETRRQ